VLRKQIRRGRTSTPEPAHPFFDRCQHGTQFLDECVDCPDGSPEVPRG